MWVFFIIIIYILHPLWIHQINSLDYEIIEIACMVLDF